MKRDEVEHRVALHRGKIDTLFCRVFDPAVPAKRRQYLLGQITKRMNWIENLVLSMED